MSKTRQNKRLAEVHARAVERMGKIQTAVKDERLQCLQDRRFYSIAGAQWEGALGDQFENKPKFEVNKIHLAVIKIINEYRNNRITVDFVSKDGEDRSKLADTCDMLYRATEQDSVADEAYDNAFEEAVGGGFGAWRLRACYEDDEDEDNDHQQIKIEPIFDADSCVFFDPNAKRQDKSDAKYAFVLTAMSDEAYRDEYDDEPESWSKEITNTEFDWSTDGLVFVAEYYEIEEETDTVQVWETLDGEEKKYREEDFETDETLEQTLKATGYKLIKSKNIKCKVVHKYILSGGCVLEDCGRIAGKHIPIVPVYGKRWVVDGVERCMGHVRLAKDAQRLKNMQLSKLGEISALSSVEKPILTPQQISGHQNMWAKDPLENYPYLLINQIDDGNGNKIPAPPVGYTKPPAIPPAMAALLQITDQDIREVLGNTEAGEQIQPNLSGKAVELIQNKLDMQTYIYMSNMAKAIKRSGEIWLSIAKEVYADEGRKVKGITRQDKPQSIELLKPIVNKTTGEIETINNLGEADFDLAVSVGPSSESKRASTVRALTSMMTMTSDPEAAQVLQAMAMMNIEGEGVDDVRDFFRHKLLKMGAVKPTEEEAQQMAQEAQGQAPDPNTQYLQAAAAEAEANAAAARAKTVLTINQAEKAKADTIKVMSEVDSNEQQQALEVIDRFGQPQNTSTVVDQTPPAM
jgi:hypothetical protein